MTREEKFAEACNLSRKSQVDEGEAIAASEPLPQDNSISAGSPQRIHERTPRIRAFLARLRTGSVLTCSADVEDMVQDVMERAVRYWDSFDPQAGTLNTWLMKIAFRTFLDHRASAERRPRAMGEEVATLADPKVDGADSRDEVSYLLSQLSAIEQDIMLRFHSRRESIEEISAAFNMPAGTIKSHLHRARRKLTRHRQESSE